MSIIGKMVGENPSNGGPFEESTPFIHHIYHVGYNFFQKISGLAGQSKRIEQFQFTTSHLGTCALYHQCGRCGLYPQHFLATGCRDLGWWGGKRLMWWLGLMCSHRIHVFFSVYLYTYMKTIYKSTTVNVGKYISPMDGMGWDEL